MFRRMHYILRAVMQKIVERKWHAGKAAVDTH